MLPTLKIVFSVSLLCWGFSASLFVVMGNRPVCSCSFVSTSCGMDGITDLSSACVACTIGGPWEDRLAPLISLCSLLGLFEPLPMLSAEVETSEWALFGVRGIDSGDLGTVAIERMLLIGEGVCLDFPDEAELDSLASLRPAIALLKAEAPDIRTGDVAPASFGGTGGGGGSLDGCAGRSKDTLRGVWGCCSLLVEGPEPDLDTEARISNTWIKSCSAACDLEVLNDRRDTLEL